MEKLPQLFLYANFRIQRAITHSKGRFSPPIRSTRSSRSPKFPHQARPNSIKFDQLLDRGCTRVLPDRYSARHDPHTTIHNSSTTSTRQPSRSLYDHLDLYAISTRSVLDQLNLFSTSTRLLLDLYSIVYGL